MDYKLVKIVVFTPVPHAEKIRKVMAEAGAGHISNYDCCSFSSRGIGRFRPLDDAKPFIGSVGKLEEVEEERIEMICPVGFLKEVVWEIKKAHPYEKPAIDIYPLLNQ